MYFKVYTPYKYRSDVSLWQGPMQKKSASLQIKAQGPGQQLQASQKQRAASARCISTHRTSIHFSSAMKLSISGLLSIRRMQIVAHGLFTNPSKAAAGIAHCLFSSKIRFFLISVFRDSRHAATEGHGTQTSPPILSVN